MAPNPPRHPRRRSPQARAAAPLIEPWLLGLGAIAFTAVLYGSLHRGEPPPAPRRRLTMAEARASNAVVPMVVADRGVAAPFRFTGGAAARAQATECLATAALYEAGDDRAGQRAVIQVVLNRARAPGYPRTICGVVYQGYERETGCQFSFTCDGSFGRRPIHRGWGQARRLAARALAGHVDARVGRATHYHTDWVVPFWRPTLTKVARVGSHLFYVPTTHRETDR